jgi:hypothetical protein
MIAHPPESSVVENAGRRLAGMLGGDDVDDEVGVIDSLLMGGLGGGHEMCVDLGSPLGSRPADDLAHHHQGAGGQLTAVVVGRDVGIAHETQQPVEFLHSCFDPSLVDCATRASE